MPLTIEQLKKIIPNAGQRAGVFFVPLTMAMDEFSINTPRRIAAFIAQIAHESGSFRYTCELASGAAYDTGRLAQRLGNTPEADGDGQRYKGRGLIQITGHDNYRDCSIALYGDPATLLENPQLLEAVDPATRSAAWFWKSRGLNELSDQPNSFQTITKRINGGLNGYAERLAFFQRATAALSC